MDEPIISVSGMRGIVGQSLSVDHLQRYSRAFASSLPAGPIVLARDGRANGVSLAGEIAAALQAIGRDVLLADIAATPTVGVQVRAQQAVGAIQLTASHNPPEYNGLKLISAAGRLLTAAAGQQVLDIYKSASSAPAATEPAGSRQLAHIEAAHLELLLATVNVERIRAAGFTVLLDSNHGAGSLLGLQLLEALGCECLAIGETADGQFAHPAEPTAENLESVLDRVPGASADVGFCQDPDADRLAIIDQRGVYLGEELTLALCLDHVLSQRPGNVVVNCATSSSCQQVAERHAASLTRTAVGEANVVEGMLAHDAVFGGEGNGGPIDPRVGWMRDSFVGIAQVLDAMAASGLSISELAGRIPVGAIVKQVLPLPADLLADFFDLVEQHFPAATPSRLDGLRLDWPDRWLLVRGSNTEPIVRCIAEAESAELASELCQQAHQLAAGLSD